ncbi:hypothetical protein SPRG_06592 [Saprolegnia parasitica CBS 223.65]|uniref:Gem-associated protein 6 n=1 Tax=Saprolegnia parasitica (strain CBS 223.65) TaxID=695850 RepID=A0A067CCY7_SAPPC|nr:hypothetical protein SPRG_06592 [Saprolegnia parasitica CBS 223.65]KDO28353.1 hypothetical protein SPRG_06592 [Saprolegnia parasitica CBS 223.65]|eukprot:XP_012200801.1 hypothetical protein SPRG_06592 [Saprolegnia parasitica CBS 223.65]
MAGAHAVYVAHAHLVGAAVVLRQTNMSFLRGALYSVDPENGIVVLLTLDDDAMAVQSRAVMSHAIAAIEEDADGGVDIAALRAHVNARAQSKRFESHEAAQLALQTFLASRCIETTMGAEKQLLVFGGAATISPPYDAFAITSQNDFVAQRLKGLLHEWEAQTTT